MSEIEIGKIVLSLGILISLAHCMGAVFEALKQPRVIGEILSGVLIGPYVLGKLFPSLQHFLIADQLTAGHVGKEIIGFLYWMGLLSLMFVSGFHARGLFATGDRRSTLLIFVIRTALPFLSVFFLALNGYIPTEMLIGSANNQMALILVLSISVAVTSIPVISRIFNDLGILNTRFAQLILGVAVIEDMALWTVLAVATTLVSVNSLTYAGDPQGVTMHLSGTLLYCAFGGLIAPRLLRRFRSSRWNMLMKASPTGYLLSILFLYVAIAASLKVNLVFAAFLAGLGIMEGGGRLKESVYSDAPEAIRKFAYGFFIPVYFALVGYKLNLGEGFSLSMLAGFLVLSSLLSLGAMALASKAAGYSGIEILNLAITANARGGPGIVLASVAYEANIIGAKFYTTLIITAILTSQAAGIWLKTVIQKGWPLLKEDRGK